MAFQPHLSSFRALGSSVVNTAENQVCCACKQACLLFDDEFIYLAGAKAESQIEPYTSASLEPINPKQINSSIHLRTT